MQLYALSSGSPLRGGLSMLLFSLGTVPLMFGLGALSSFLSNGSRGRKITAAVMKVGAVLVAALGLTMFSNGWVLSGVDFNIGERVTAFFNPFTASQFSTAAAQSTPVSFTPVIESGVQIVNSSLSGGRYPAITVQQGIPVKWIIDAPQGSINGCNNQMIIREYGIEYHFQTGENVIEFMPEKEGRFSYSCWMGMIRSSITVVAAGQSPVDVKEPETAPVPAGVIIPTETIAVAEMRDGGEYQWVVINLRDDGIEPAVIVVQEDVPTQWIVNNDSLDPGNSRLVFPAYYTQFDMEQGDNEISLLPTADFDFSTVDNIFYGYVKVVDNIDSVNIDVIKAEVGNYETLIYPAAYFDAASEGAGCCSPAR
jgi:plastocyanin domain-containing protein